MNFVLTTVIFTTSTPLLFGLGNSNPSNSSATGATVLERINTANLVITTTINEPYVMVKKAPPGKRYVGNGRFEGFCVDLITLICARWNWTCTIKPTPDGRYGALKNGKWDGLIGQLHRGEADIAAASLAITRTRWPVVAFSPPILTTGLSLMVKRPGSQAITTAPLSPFWFLRPLGSPVLLAMVFVWIVWSAVCSVAIRWRSDNGRETSKAKSPCWHRPFGCLSTPRRLAPVRSIASWLLNVCWWFFTVLIVAIYSLKLGGYLRQLKSSGMEELKIDSVEDLLAQSDVKFGTVLSGLTAMIFRDSKFPLYQRMWEAMESEEPSVFVSNYSVGVQRVRESNGRYAFIVEGLINDYISAREPCDTQAVGKLLSSISFAFATRLKSPLKAKLDDSILEMQENGMIQKLQKRWWSSGSGRGLCKMPKPTSNPSEFNLKLDDVRGVFYLLLSGFLVALAVSYVEFVYLSYSKSAAKRIRVKNTMDPEIYFAARDQNITDNNHNNSTELH